MAYRSCSGFLFIISLVTGTLLCPALVRAQLNVSLVPSDYNGYNISCFGGGDGSIDLTVTGGTPPYTYGWSTGATTQDVADLRAGFISVQVRDAAAGQARMDLTLTEPYELQADVEPYLYPSGFNISCHSCYNGNIQVTPVEGVSPYTYAWADGPTTEDRTQLDAGSYDIVLTDANGCVFREDKILLTQPERDDWSKSGNAGTNPAVHYFGTSDNQDVVFKANGSESFRLKSNGDIKLGGSLTGYGLLYRHADGTLRTAEAQPQGSPCFDRAYWPPFWKSGGNAFNGFCPGPPAVLGTTDTYPLTVITNNATRMSINSVGKLVYGTNLGTSPGFNLISDGSVGMQAQAEAGIPLTIKRNQGDYIQFKRTIQDDPGYWGIHNGDENQQHLAFHYYVPGGQSLMNRLVLWNDGKVSFAGKVQVGNVGTESNDYSLFVEKGVLTERVKVAVHNEGDWNDQVFDSTYKLLPIPQLSQYLAEHRHLPDVPSAKEVVKEGLDVAKSDALLLKKIEELTLYIIQLEARMSAMEQQSK